MTHKRPAHFLFAILCLLAAAPAVQAQAAPEAEAEALREKLARLRQTVLRLKERERNESLAPQARPRREHVADVEVCAKAADWILRHDEFYKPDYVRQTHQALDLGLRRGAQLLEDNAADWFGRAGTTVLGYESRVDGSVQPYSVTLPAGVEPHAPHRWPLHVVLHGRAAEMNEVNFIHRHEGKPLPDDEDRDWIQLDVYGRGNNAYRFAGETDVFEALADIKRRFRIDDRRVTLRGFSMGGAGAWHLGLHHPSRWSSVGAGAGFVDFYNYQKVEEKLPEWQHKALAIHDADKYALNAFNVPTVGYGGELDPQLAAAKTMAARGEELDVPIKLLIGPETAHKFHPDSLREFMDFHRRHSEQGRPAYPGQREIRFVTYTLKYNECEWLTVEEMLQMYKPATVAGGLDDQGILRLETGNVATLRIARDVAEFVSLDGAFLPLQSAADGLLPDVFFEIGRDAWRVLDYDESRVFATNPQQRKRRDLQGPIDDAFMQPFVCVRATGEAWSPPQAEWAQWTLERFEREFDKHLRGRVPVVDDVDVTDELIAEKHLVLFGDPGSNAVLKNVLDRLPVKWSRETLEVAGRTYDPATHGVSLVFPNPLNPQRYVVVNSGHTFHDREFRASNAQLFPRLGDVAVQRFEKRADGGYDETIEWADLFNPSWRLTSDTVE